MSRSVSAHQLFDRPIEDTWETLVSIERYPEMTSSYVEVNPLTDSLRGVGARWDQTRIVWGRQHTHTMEVVAWEPPTSFTLQASEAGATYETSHRLGETAAGTEVEMTFAVVPTGTFGKAVNMLMGRKLMAATRETMAEILEEIAASAGQGNQ